MALAVVADDGDGDDRAHAQGSQVVDDGAGGAGIGANACHLIGVESRFERRFGEGGIEIEIPVQKQIAGDGDPQRGRLVRIVSSVDSVIMLG